MVADAFSRKSQGVLASVVRLSVASVRQFDLQYGSQAQGVLGVGRRDGVH